MKQKQIDEIKCVEYFIPSNYDGNGIYDKQVIFGFYMHNNVAAMEDNDGDTPEECFINYSSRGIIKHKTTDVKRFFQLLEGNRWRGIHIFELYEPSILEGSWTYSDLIEMPEYVVKYIAKQIFKGIDKEVIMDLWKLKRLEEIKC